MLPLSLLRSWVVLSALLCLAGCQLALANRTPDDSDLDLDDVWQQYAAPLTEEELFEEVIEGTLPMEGEPTGIDLGSAPGMFPTEDRIVEGSPEGGTSDVLDLPDEIPPDPLAGIPPPLAEGPVLPMDQGAPVAAGPISTPARAVGPSRVRGGVPPPPPPPEWDPSLDRRVNVKERELPAGVPLTTPGPVVEGPTVDDGGMPPPVDVPAGAESGAGDTGFLEPTETELAHLDPSMLPAPGDSVPAPVDPLGAGPLTPTAPAVAPGPVRMEDPLCPPTGELPSPLDAQPLGRQVPGPRATGPQPGPGRTEAPDPTSGILPHHPPVPGEGALGPDDFPEEMPIGTVRPRQPAEPLPPVAPPAKPAESSQDLGAPPTGVPPRETLPGSAGPAPVSPAPTVPTPGTEEDPWATEPAAPLPIDPAPSDPAPADPAPAAPPSGMEDDPWATPAPAAPAPGVSTPGEATPASGVDDDPWATGGSTPAGNTPSGARPTGFVSETREGKALEQVTRLLDAPGDPKVAGYPDEVVPKAEAWVALRTGPRPLVVVFHDDSLRTSDRMAAEILPVLARYGPRVDVVTVDRNPAATRDEYEQQAVERFLGDSDDVPVTIVTDEERNSLLVKFGWFPAEELETVLRQALGESAAALEEAGTRTDPILDPLGPSDTPDPLDPLPAPGQTPPPGLEPMGPSTPRDEHRFSAPQSAQAKAHADRLRASPTDRRLGGYPKSLVRRANPRLALEPGHRPVVVIFHDDTSRPSNLQAADWLETVVELQDSIDFVVIDASSDAKRTPDEQKVFKPYYPGIVPSTFVMSPSRNPVKLWFRRVTAKSLRGAVREAQQRR